MTDMITRSAPPQRLVNGINPIVRAVIRSRLHALVDSSMLMLHVVGRRTGRRYDIPVQYIASGGGLVVVTQHGWRANLRGGVLLEVTHRGRRGRMYAELEENPKAVALVLRPVIERFGIRAARTRLGLRIHLDRVPTLAELEDAVREFGLVTVTLTRE